MRRKASSHFLQVSRFCVDHLYHQDERYLADVAHVCKWVSKKYGVRSGVAAVYMQHAAINCTPMVCPLSSVAGNICTQDAADTPD